MQRKRAQNILPRLGLLLVPALVQPAVAEETSARAHVVELAAPAGPACGARCTAEAYRRFAERHRGPGAPLSKSELEAEIEALFKAPRPAPKGLSAQELEREVPERLDIAFLLQGLSERPLEVAVVGERRRRGFVEREVELRDPEVGRFRGVVLIPDGAGPFPAVLALHGHRSSARRFARQYVVRTLAERGFVVALPSFRLFGCGPREEATGRFLLRNGSTLLGLRVYEAVLMAEYLRSLDTVDVGRVGMIGHSGGSTVALLLARISSWFRVVVLDHLIDFRNRCWLWQRVHCETVPSLFPISADIRDRSSLPIPHLLVRYGYPGRDLREEVLAFLAAHLRDDDDGRAAGDH